VLLLSDTAGAFGGVAIGLNGLVTAVIVPLSARLFEGRRLCPPPLGSTLLRQRTLTGLRDTQPRARAGLQPFGVGFLGFLGLAIGFLLSFGHRYFPFLVAADVDIGTDGVAVRYIIASFR
jgi:hypothetical protein